MAYQPGDSDRSVPLHPQPEPVSHLGPDGQRPTPQAPPEVSDEVLSRLKPVMLLIAATLQTAGEQCACRTCRLLQAHAGELVPLIIRMSDPGEAP